jgi:hypothetical protein
LVVVDLDEGGAESLATLELEHGKLPETFEVETARGRHLYFWAPEGCPANSASRLGVGIDIRGNGGFVIAEGSRHKSGTVYTARRRAPIAALPNWVTDQLSAKDVRGAATPVRSDKMVPEGKRNDTLYRHACSMRRRDMSEEAAMEALLAENRNRCRPPLTEAEVLKIQKNAWQHPPTPGADGSRPRIPAGDTALIPVVRQACTAIKEWNDPPKLFVYGDILQVLRPTDKNHVRLGPVDEQQMRIILAQAAEWYRVTQNGQEKVVRPPLTIAKAMMAWDGRFAPPLNRIVTAPVFGSDGVLCLEPGYHPECQLWYARTADLANVAVGEAPSATDVAAALTLLEELLFDFPFSTESDLANCIGLILLAFVRDMIDGPTPLHLIEKPTPGTGASLLAEVVTILMLGRPAVGMTEGRAEDEMRKRITSKLLQATNFVLIDNVNRLDSPALAAAVTLDVFEDRLLGQSRMLQLPVRCVWIATGNNPVVSRELARRIVPIRLDAGCERPWERPASSFRHANLRQWVSENRAELVSAILTLVQTWISVGRPMANHAFGGMERWAAIIGGILETVGVRGFLSNLHTFYERSDYEGAAWNGFVAAWWETHEQSPVGVAELFVLVQDNDVPIDLGPGSERSQRTRLGKAIGRIEGRRFGALRLERAAARGRAAKWQLLNTAKAASGPAVSRAGGTLGLFEDGAPDAAAS